MKHMQFWVLEQQQVGQYQIELMTNFLLKVNMDTITQKQETNNKPLNTNKYILFLQIYFIHSMKAYLIAFILISSACSLHLRSMFQNHEKTEVWNPSDNDNNEKNPRTQAPPGTLVWDPYQDNRDNSADSGNQQISGSQQNQKNEQLNDNNSENQISPAQNSDALSNNPIQFDPHSSSTQQQSPSSSIIITTVKEQVISSPQQSTSTQQNTNPQSSPFAISPISSDPVQYVPQQTQVGSQSQIPINQQLNRSPSSIYSTTPIIVSPIAVTQVNPNPALVNSEPIGYEQRSSSPSNINNVSSVPADTYVVGQQSQESSSAPLTYTNNQFARNWVDSTSEMPIPV